MKAFSYLRVSTKGQIDGDGFERQRLRIAEWAKKNKAQIVSEFLEEGISGSNDMDQRPAMADMIVAIKSNGVRVVVVERADRFARDYVAAELLLREFKKHGVSVIEADGGHDLTKEGQDNPTARLVRQILTAVAEFDKTSIVLKLKAARIRARRETGRCEGRKPYGDRDGEQAVIERMRALRRKPPKGKRMSLQKVADTLNEEKAPTRTGAKWSAELVRRILGRKGGTP